jgi:hypothetical protein
MNTEGGGVLTIWEEGAGEEGAGCGGVTGSDEVGGGGAKGGSEDEARDAEGDLVGEDWIRAGLGSSTGEAGAISRSEACLAWEVGVCARDVSALWSGIVGEEASSGWAGEAERVAGVGPSGEAPSSPEWGRGLQRSNISEYGASRELGEAGRRQTTSVKFGKQNAGLKAHQCGVFHLQ